MSYQASIPYAYAFVTYIIWGGFGQQHRTNSWSLLQKSPIKKTMFRKRDLYFYHICDRVDQASMPFACRAPCMHAQQVWGTHTLLHALMSYMTHIFNITGINSLLYVIHIMPYMYVSYDTTHIICDTLLYVTHIMPYIYIHEDASKVMEAYVSHIISH